MSTQERSFGTAVWDFFCSLKLTIVTLILLALTSIIGTVIQQNRSPQEYLEAYGEITYRIFDALGFFNMYYSWWFLALLGIFSLNLIACSIKRFPRVWKVVNEPVLVPSDGLYRTFSNVSELVVDAPMDQVRERLDRFLRSKFSQPVITEEEGKYHFFAQKGAYSRFGVYITHLSILVIFLGAIVGSLFGYKAYVNIVEGSSTSQVWPRGSDTPIPLDFEVRCEDFSMSFYEGQNQGRPKEYRSVLTVVENGEVVVKDRPIVVNDPLTYKGITFYQSSYGPAGDPEISLGIQNKETGENFEKTVALGKRASLPGGGVFQVAGFTQAERQFGPAVQIYFFPPEGSPRELILYRDFPRINKGDSGKYTFSMDGYDQTYYTGLQVAKDPGVWIVWVGCALLVVGSLVAFFLSHRRIWATVQPVGNKVGIKIGGTVNRNQPGFELFFDELKKDLKKEFSA